ncbi:unnamed protein product [Nippostrongylus brasiliensis]|uniref:DOMON domain-containing protein n=1 Tax=Nippostrongylus brasiliensis TaxID=27835 RepID=A0A0N4YS52_NIPBR|nr:unnamed protein product [Nippostrongylus brasiliensis]
MDTSTCGQMKGCLFAPEGCQAGVTCQIHFSYQVDGNSLAMELYGTPPVSNGYIAGDDMVVYCAQFGNGQVVGGLALNGKKPNNTIISNVGIQDVPRTASVGGALYCAIR